MEFDQFIQMLMEYKKSLIEGKAIKVEVQGSASFNMLGVLNDDGLIINISKID